VKSNLETRILTKYKRKPSTIGIVITIKRKKPSTIGIVITIELYLWG